MVLDTVACTRLHISNLSDIYCLTSENEFVLTVKCHTMFPLYSKIKQLTEEVDWILLSVSHMSGLSVIRSWTLLTVNIVRNLLQNFILKTDHISSSLSNYTALHWLCDSVRILSVYIFFPQNKRSVVYTTHRESYPLFSQCFAFSS